MSDTEMLWVGNHSTVDDRTYVFHLEETQLQELAGVFHLDIFFVLTDEEYEELTGTVDNLKNDFIYFVPGVNKRSKMVCTCGEFESAESTDAGQTHLAKWALRHHKKADHDLNPWGN